jgi:hypothetical protein
MSLPSRDELVELARSFTREDTARTLTQRLFLRRVGLGDRQFYALFHGGWDEFSTLVGIPRHPHRGTRLDLSREQLVETVRATAKALGQNTLTLPEFERRGGIKQRAVYKLFPSGGWIEACHLAGIEPGPGYMPRLNDEQLLQEFHRIVSKFGRIPPGHLFDSESAVSLQTMRKRFGGTDRLMLRYRDWLLANSPSSDLLRLKSLPRVPGFSRDARPTVPTVSPSTEVGEVLGANESFSRSSPSDPPQPYRPDRNERGGSPRSREIEFGPPINFRGLQHGPVNEQGVVFLFGLVSRDLGFLVESVRSSFPDCEGKRCVDKKRNRWKRVRVEFEFMSSGFREHGHDPDGCDVIVCWEHDWAASPVEVIELRSEIARLPP